MKLAHRHVFSAAVLFLCVRAQGQQQLAIGTPTVNGVATCGTPSVTNPKLAGGTFTVSFSLSCSGNSVSANATLTVPTAVTGAPSNDASNTFVLSPGISVSASITGTGILGPNTAFPGPTAPLVSVTVFSSKTFLPGCNKEVFGADSDVNTTASVSSCPVSALIGSADKFGNPTPGPPYAKVVFEAGFNNLNPSVEVDIPYGAAQPSFKIDHVEAFQAVQNATNDLVPLIQNKKTLVRVFLVSNTDQPVEIETATLNGQPTISTSGTTALPPPPPDRTNAGTQMLFVLPTPPTALSITVTPRNGAQVQGNYALPVQSATKAPQDFYVGYVDVCVVQQGAADNCPDETSAPDAIDEAKGVFPFPDSTFTYFALPLDPIKVPQGVFPDFDLQLSRILFKYWAFLNVYNLLPGVPRIDHLTGFTPTIYSYSIGSYASYETLAQAINGPKQISWGRSEASQELLAHRLGHQFGLTDHSGSVGEVGWQSWLFSYYTVYSPLFAPAGPNLMDPTASFTMISPADFNQLFNSPTVPIVPADRPVKTELLRAAATAATTDYVLVSGTVQRDGSGAQIDPVYHVSTARPQRASDPNGNHCLLFRNGGNTLSQYCFNLDVSSAGLNQQIFAVTAPWPAGTTQLALVRGGSTLAALSAAANDPVVTITSPGAGGQLQGNGTISWSVTGAAGPVMSTVLYSPDGGNSWLPLVTDIPDMQYAFDTSKIMGGAQVYLRVIAASGLNSGSATVGPINIPQTPKIGASLPALDFGNVVIGQQASQTIAITNTGSGPISIGGLSVDNPAFSVFSSHRGLLPAGSKWNITVNFSPAAAGGQKGTLAVQSSDPATPSFTIPLTGTAFSAAQPSINVIQTVIDFGNVPVGQSGEMPLPLINSGAAALNISQISANNPQFAVSGNLPPTVAAGIEQDVALRFTPAGTGLQTANVVVSSNDPTHGSLVVKVQGTGTAANSAAPQIKSGGVVDGATFRGALVPGGLATIFGFNFVAGSGNAQASSLPLPTTLLNVTVTVAGIPAPLIFVNATQINFQVPFEVTIGTLVPVVVTVNGVASASIVAPVARYAVGVFTYARTASILDPIIVHASTNALVTPANPAQPNEVLVVYATGVGDVVNRPPTGTGAPSTVLASAVDTPTITLGNALVTVLFAGLTPGFVGLVQINIQLPTTLPGSGSLPLVIQFPNDTSAPVNLYVPGTATVPKLGLSSNSLTFGNVTVGQTQTQTVTVSNNGTAALNVTAVSVTGSGFSLTSASSFSVAEGTSQSVTVRFAPTQSGPANGTLTIASNDPNQPNVSVPLTGTGVAAAPSISVTPASLDFGTITAGLTKDLTFTVQNNGDSSIQVTAVSSSSNQFRQVLPSLPFGVGAGSSQVVTIRFSPSAAGTQSGIITITTGNAAASAVTVSVTGAGAPSGGGGGPFSIYIVPISLDFGTVTPGQTKDMTFTVRNNGFASIQISVVTSSNQRFAWVLPTGPFGVGAGSTQLVTIRFSPTAAGAQSGTLTVSSNDPTTPSLNVNVTGNTGSASSGGSAQCSGTGPGGFGVTLAGGPVCTEITNGVCPATQPVSFATLGSSDPNITVWYELDGLIASSSVLTRFSFNGTLAPSLDYGPFGPNFFQGGTYVLCPGIVPNASAERRATENGQNRNIC